MRIRGAKGTATQFAATINWGDGTTTTVTVTVAPLKTTMDPPSIGDSAQQQ